MNYKIKVNNEAESKEVQDLFFELGYSWNGNKKIQELSYPLNGSYWLCTKTGMGLFNCIKWGTGHDSGKEITLPELRDMVVLKRNSIDDATHGNESAQRGYLASDGVEYIYDFYDKKWRRFPTLTFSSSKLKPIEKPMKEYLNKETHEFVRSHSELNDMWIEIPEGANFAAFNQALNNYYFNEENIYIPDYVIWQRYQEETISDKVASAEIARQESKEWDLGGYDFAESDALIGPNVEQAKHNHYYIDVSNVDEVDFYEIALRYNVTDPCIQHILKKCLAVGNRGHKDFHTDLKDIYDTAKRALDIHKVDQ